MLSLVVLEEEKKATTSGSDLAKAEGFHSDSPSSLSSSPPGQPGSSKWVIDEGEILQSTWEHRLWTYGSMALMGAHLSVGLLQVDSPVSALQAVGVLALAYGLADVGTGIYHWGVDNYGGADTPIFGRQIAAFQGHHQKPWTITQREFCNNVHQVFKPAAFPAGLFLLLSPVLPPLANVFLPSFIFLVAMSQQFHAWSHMKKSELHPWVVQLQDANLLISRKAHGAHHLPPFEANYSIVSGWSNGPLDSINFYRGLEHLVKNMTGVEPRCWHEPDYEWKEQERAV